MHSAGAQRRTVVHGCACFPVRLKTEGETKRALVFWVCLAGASSQRLWFQSVTVSRDCGSVSAALLPSPYCLSILSRVAPNTCSLEAQGRVSSTTEGCAATSLSLGFSPSIISPLCSFHPQNKTAWEKKKYTTSKRSVRPVNELHYSKY